MLKVRKRLGRMPMFPDTNDGTAIHLNGATRPFIGRLLRVGSSDRLRLVLNGDYMKMFEPFHGYEIGDDVNEVRALLRLLSTHSVVMYEGEHGSNSAQA